MAKSKAKKYREKLQREGRRNPEDNRLMWGFDPRERRTKTKAEKINQILKKEKQYLRKYKNQKRDFDESLF